MEDYRLLGKTELWIKPIHLEGANLSDIAEAASKVLGLPSHLVAVTDAVADALTIDVLTDLVDPRQIIGQEKALLKAVGACAGVHLPADSRVHSDGVLGFVVIDPEEAERFLRSTEEALSEVEERLARRVIVFPTGNEVCDGLIEDTNTPLITEKLASEGYTVHAGPALRDDAHLIAEAFHRAADAAYGLVITTGGVGAEKKDRTIEALLLVDPGAPTPYLLKFTKGTGRHTKDGVRVGVGEVGSTRIVFIPGPTGEVGLCLGVIAEGLAQHLRKEALAEKLAQALRQRFYEVIEHRHR